MTSTFTILYKFRAEKGDFHSVSFPGVASVKIVKERICSVKKILSSRVELGLVGASTGVPYAEENMFLQRGTRLIVFRVPPVISHEHRNKRSRNTNQSFSTSVFTFDVVDHDDPFSVIRKLANPEDATNALSVEDTPQQSSFVTNERACLSKHYEAKGSLERSQIPQKEASEAPMKKRKRGIPATFRDQMFPPNPPSTSSVGINVATSLLPATGGLKTLIRHGGGVSEYS